MKDKCLVAFEIGQTQADDIKEIIKDYLNDVTVIVKKICQVEIECYLYLKIFYKNV